MDNIKLFLYAIYCIEDQEMIWSARGGAYHHLDAVNKKLAKLREKNPTKTYTRVKYTVSDIDLIRGEKHV